MKKRAITVEQKTTMTVHPQGKGTGPKEKGAALPVGKSKSDAELLKEFQAHGKKFLHPEFSLDLEDPIEEAGETQAEETKEKKAKLKK